MEGKQYRESKKNNLIWNQTIWNQETEPKIVDAIILSILASA